MARNPGGTVSGFKLLSTPDAPTIDSVTTSIGSATVAFTPPTDVGDAAVSSYVVTAVDESSGASTGATGSASPINLSLSSGTFKIRMQALNAYGPGRLTEYDTGNVVTYSGLQLWTWGYNNNGQLGDGTVVARSSPVQVGAQTTWRSLSFAFGMSAAVTSDGTLYAWGQNTSGNLGLGDRISRSSPVQVGALTNWHFVASGGANNSVAAIKTDGTLWTWGDNLEGKLGQNNTGIDRSSPIQVGALTDWSTVSVGPNFCVAIKSNGTLWSWGRNNYGQLGQNLASTSHKSSPTQVGALTTWASVSAGFGFVLASTTSNALYAWGINGDGQLGQGNIIRRSSPVQVGALTDWLQPSAGFYVSSSIKTDGTLWAWGDNNKGQIGDGTVVNRSSPVQIGALTNWAQVSALTYNICSIKTDGSLWIWGANSSGELGQGTRGVGTDRSSPVQVGALTNWYSLAKGVSNQSSSHTLALYGVV